MTCRSKVISTSGFAVRHLEILVAYSSNVHQRRQTSGSVLSVNSKSGVVENVGTAFGIALQTTTVQKLFLVPVCRGHLDSVVSNVLRYRLRHDQVGRGRKCGGSRWINVCMLLET